MATKKYESSIPLKDYISVTLEKDTTYNYNIMNQLIPKYNMNGKWNKAIKQNI